MTPPSGRGTGRVWLHDTGEHRIPMPDSRPMSYSRAELTTLVMPHMQNVLGDLFGGELMSLVDQAAAVAAIRHAGGPAGTPGIGRGGFCGRGTGGGAGTCRGSGG